ncbi:MAG TPA: hypothetical protein VFK97_00145 [Candidatus Saccharimonadales bacterium]|nr:hypothetical protein [Candidatus Saccharimonadales bacterium]
MELIESEPESEQGSLPKPEPRYKPANLPVKRTDQGQTWLRLAAATVAAIILVILIVLLARWIYLKAHNHATPATPATPAVQAPSAVPKKPSKTSGGTSNNSNNKPASPNSNPQITNTGPGNTAAIFVGASLVAGGLHYVISVRRFAKNS